jgi:hypothetical protein
VEALFNEASCLEPSDPLADGLVLLIIKASQALLGWMGIQQDVQGVLNNLTWDSSHVKQFTCNDLLVLV